MILFAHHHHSKPNPTTIFHRAKTQWIAVITHILHELTNERRNCENSSIQCNWNSSERFGEGPRARKGILLNKQRLRKIVHISYDRETVPVFFIAYILAFYKQAVHSI